MLERLVIEDAVREVRWTLLVRALVAADRRPEALHAYDRARRLLATELGIPPGVQLAAAHAAALRADTSTTGGDDPIVAADELMRAATTKAHAGDVRGATRTFVEAADLARRCADVRRFAEAALGAAVTGREWRWTLSRRSRCWSARRSSASPAGLPGRGRGCWPGSASCRARARHRRSTSRWRRRRSTSPTRSTNPTSARSPSTRWPAWSPTRCATTSGRPGSISCAPSPTPTRTSRGAVGRCPSRPATACSPATSPPPWTSSARSRPTRPSPTTWSP